jgi:hypothetical protein
MDEAVSIAGSQNLAVGGESQSTNRRNVYARPALSRATVDTGEPSTVKRTVPVGTPVAGAWGVTTTLTACWPKKGLGDEELRRVMVLVPLWDNTSADWALSPVALVGLALFGSTAVTK